MKSVNVLLVKRMLLRDRNQKDVFSHCIYRHPVATRLALSH